MIWVLIHIAAIQNYYTGTYIIMACLQSLVNNLHMLVWQSSKLCPLNSESISQGGASQSQGGQITPSRHPLKNLA